jgi:hypothetical protein
MFFFALLAFIFPLLYLVSGPATTGCLSKEGKKREEKYHGTFSAYYSADGKKRMLISGGRQEVGDDDTITN